MTDASCTCPEPPPAGALHLGRCPVFKTQFPIMAANPPPVGALHLGGCPPADPEHPHHDGRCQDWGHEPQQVCKVCHTRHPAAVCPGPSAGRGSSAVNHPAHYNRHPSGVECITIVRHLNFNVGNAMKYLWRAGIKDEDTEVEDLRKAVWYLNDEIKRLEGEE